jgi:hypothetical protein
MRIPRGVAVAGSMAVAGGLAAALNFAPSAVAQLSSLSGMSPVSPVSSLTVRIGNFGAIRDRGLTALVPATVTCNVPGTTSVNLQLRERVGNRIATAAGNTTIPCTGQPVVVPVRLDAYQVPVRRGQGIVDASVWACPAFGPCLQAIDRRTVYFF